MTFWGLLGLYAVSFVCAYALVRVRLADADAKYPALQRAKYPLGSFLVVTIALIKLLLVNATHCTVGTRASGTLSIDETYSATRRWYAVLTDLQSCIGAFAGLLGLALSTLLNALMNKSVRIEGN